MTRINFDTYLLALARTASQRGTCGKRQVGAVIADVNKLIVAVSYNGPPSGQPHCIDSPCKAMTMRAPQSHLACRSVHGEANALLLAGGRARQGWMAITTSPCYECAKLIVTSGIQHLVFGELNRLFDDETTYSESPRQHLAASNISWIVDPP